MQMKEYMQVPGKKENNIKEKELLNKLMEEYMKITGSMDITMERELSSLQMEMSMQVTG